MRLLLILLLLSFVTARAIAQSFTLQVPGNSGDDICALANGDAILVQNLTARGTVTRTNGSGATQWCTQLGPAIKKLWGPVEMANGDLLFCANVLDTDGTTVRNGILRLAANGTLIRLVVLRGAPNTYSVYESYITRHSSDNGYHFTAPSSAVGGNKVFRMSGTDNVISTFVKAGNGIPVTGMVELRGSLYGVSGSSIGKMTMDGQLLWVKETGDGQFYSFARVATKNNKLYVSYQHVNEGRRLPSVAVFDTTGVLQQHVVYDISDPEGYPIYCELVLLNDHVVLAGERSYYDSFVIRSDYAFTNKTFYIDDRPSSMLLGASGVGHKLMLVGRNNGSYRDYFTVGTTPFDLTTQCWSTPTLDTLQLPFPAMVNITRTTTTFDPNSATLPISTTNPVFPPAFGCSPEMVTVPIAMSVLLGGPYDPATQRMSDLLTQRGLVPYTEPYSALGYPQVGGGGGETTTSEVMYNTDPELGQVVDWVHIELRASNVPTQLMMTRQLLLFQNGSIRDVDGSVPVFTLQPGGYYVAIRHRNHLGVMAWGPAVVVGPQGGDSFVLPFDDPAFTCYGTDARRVVGDKAVLWEGDALADGQVKYTGADNDRDPILVAIGGVTPTNVLHQAYRPEDVNMDGDVKYTGQGNDRDPILVNIGGVLPTAVRTAQLP